MEYVFYAKGHPNVTSVHKSTFEVTLDKEIGIKADCIIGVSSESKLEDFPDELRKEIQNENAVIKVQLQTENGFDEIKGYGHPELTMDHPTDMVCRKSEFKCSRTLMIRADKAAVDINKKLVNDLKEEKKLKVRIIIE